MAALGKYEVPLGLIQWAQDYSDPTNFMDWWTAQTRHPWKNEKFNELVNNARGELDKTKRCAMYNEAEKILISDVGGVFIGNPVQGEVWKPNVGGLKVAKNVGIRAHYQMMWSDIYIKK
jgi:ABC-type transport system substrate-binding protein